MGVVHVLPGDGDRLRARLRVPVFLRHDGAAAHLGENDVARVLFGSARREVLALLKRLFFLEGTRMMLASLIRDPSLRAVSREALFDALSVQDFDVSRDGSRFLMIEDATSSVRLVVVLE